MLDLKFRLIKFRLQSSQWIWFTGNEQKVKNMIHKFNPVGIYYTKGKFVNATETEIKRHRAFIISQDLVYDFDGVPIENVQKTLQIMKGKAELKYILETSPNHYQVVYHDPFKNPYFDSRRVEFYKMKNKEYLDLLTKNGIECCPQTTLNPLQVIRLPLTKHRTGFIGKYVSEAQIMALDKSTPKINKQVNLTNVKYRAIKDQVGHRWVFWLKAPFNERRLLQAQKEYQMGLLFVLDTGVISVKTFDRRRLQKIMHYMGKESNERFRFIRTSESKDSSGKTVMRAPQLKRILPAKARGSYSREHADWLIHLAGVKGGIGREPVFEALKDNLTSHNLVGNQQPKIFELEHKVKIDR